MSCMNTAGMRHRQPLSVQHQTIGALAGVHLADEPSYNHERCVWSNISALALMLMLQRTYDACMQIELSLTHAAVVHLCMPLYNALP